MADKFHNGYVQHNVTDYMDKSSEEQREFSLMMSDKMIGLDELYKTSDGKEYLDKFLKSRGIDLSKKPADMNLSDFLGQELEKGNIKADLTEVILDASNGAYERVDTPQAKNYLHFYPAIWKIKNCNHRRIYQMFTVSKMLLKKIKETHNSIRCKKVSVYGHLF